MRDYAPACFVARGGENACPIFRLPPRRGLTPTLHPELAIVLRRLLFRPLLAGCRPSLRGYGGRYGQKAGPPPPLSHYKGPNPHVPSKLGCRPPVVLP